MDAATNNNATIPPENAKPATSKQMSRGPLAVARFLIHHFSTSTRQRSPPSINKKIHIRLITISASHFCEKVRWALDHLEAKNDNPYYYTEDAHPPAFQAYETLKATNEQASITPMILWKEQEENLLLYDSTKILKRFWPELYPKEIAEDVDAMEADLGKRLGAGLRCFAYYHLLPNIKDYHELFIDLIANENKVSKIERILADAFIERGLDKGILKALEVTKEGAEASAETMKEIFKDVSERLESNGGEYIMDSSSSSSYGFTAVDLTLAALSYPLLCPPEMKDWVMDESKAPPAIREMSEELRATTAGKHVLKIYKKHRIPSPSPNNGDATKTTPVESFVTIKRAERNKYPWQS